MNTIKKNIEQLVSLFLETLEEHGDIERVSQLPKEKQWDELGDFIALL